LAVRRGFAQRTAAPTAMAVMADRNVIVGMWRKSRTGEAREVSAARPWDRLTPIDREVVGRAGGRGEGGGERAVEAVADAEAVADELIDARDRAAGIGALGTEKDERGVGLGGRARVGALVSEFAGEADVVGLGTEVQLDAEAEEVRGGFAAAFGANHFPDAVEGLAHR